MEASIQVSQALSKHAGKYQCTKQHKNFHTLKVRKVDPMSTILIHSVENITPVDDPDPETAKTTPRHHQHHHSSHHHRKTLEEEIDRDFSRLIPNRTTTEFHLNGGSVSDVTTPLLPFSKTTMLVDSDTEDSYDDNDVLEKNKSSNRELLGNVDYEQGFGKVTESNNNELDPTFMPEESVEESYSPISIVPSLMAITVAPDILTKINEIDRKTSEIHSNSTETITFTTVKTSQTHGKKGETLCSYDTIKTFF